MGFFDSASLGYGDVFITAFEKVGVHRYAIVPAGGKHLAFDFPLEIEVKDEAAAAATPQIDIAVSLNEGHFRAEPARITVGRGALVGWHAADSHVPAFAIAGQDGEFSNDPLPAPSVYSHRFLSPGSYEWADRHGGKAGGRIEVTSPGQCDAAGLAAWQRQVQEAVTIEITGRPVRKQHAVVGQAVVFLIDTPGISVADKRWAAVDPCGQSPEVEPTA
jgi:plastocyanin